MPCLKRFFGLSWCWTNAINEWMNYWSKEQMKIRFLIQRDGPQDLHWYSGPSHFRTGFMCLLVAFFPGTVGSFSVPHPPTLSTSWWWVMRWSGGTGPFGGCLAVSLMDMMGKKSRSTLSGKHSKSRNVSAVLSPTSSAASSSTGCQDKHTVPDRAELAHPPWKAFLDALTHPPLSQDPGTWSVYSFLCIILHGEKQNAFF